jgi:hypothetical protein
MFAIGFVMFVAAFIVAQMLNTIKSPIAITTAAVGVIGIGLMVSSLFVFLYRVLP